MNYTVERFNAVGAELQEMPRQARVLLSMLNRPATEIGIGGIYRTLDIVADLYGLDDASVVLFAEPLGLQVFRLKHSQDRIVAATTPHLVPGFYCDPDVVEPATKVAACNFCDLALAMHIARYFADHDHLTNLANRRHFDVALRTAAAQSSRYGWVFTLLIMDVNGLKALNERAGHGVGDQALRDFGHALRLSARSGDIMARIGGDEFAVLLGNAEGAEVMSFVDRLRSAIAERVDPANPIDFCVGTASAPRDSSDPVELRRIADTRLYEDKGKDRSPR
jgi:diguanylate cyclase (GGDEF)-like protein